MIHLYSSEDIVTNLDIAEDAEYWFNQYYRLNPKTFHNELSDWLMQEIDGVTERIGSAITNKFGTTSMDNLSTGCKAALLMTNNLGLCVSNIEMGGNAINAVFNLGNKADIHMIVYHNIDVFNYDFDQIVTLDGVEMSMENALDELDKIFDARRSNINKHTD